VPQLVGILDRYRQSLYPEGIATDLAAAERVVRAQEIAGMLVPGRLAAGAVIDTSVAGS
jgi:hypothetical protein